GGEAEAAGTARPGAAQSARHDVPAASRWRGGDGGLETPGPVGGRHHVRVLVPGKLSGGARWRWPTRGPGAGPRAGERAALGTARVSRTRRSLAAGGGAARGLRKVVRRGGPGAHTARALGRDHGVEGEQPLLQRAQWRRGDPGGALRDVVLRQGPVRAGRLREGGVEVRLPPVAQRTLLPAARAAAEGGLQELGSVAGPAPPDAGVQAAAVGNGGRAEERVSASPAVERDSGRAAGGRN